MIYITILFIPICIFKYYRMELDITKDKDVLLWYGRKERNFKFLFRL